MTREMNEGLVAFPSRRRARQRIGAFACLGVLVAAAGTTMWLSYRPDLDGALQLTRSEEEFERTNGVAALLQIGDRVAAGLQEVAKRDDTSGANARAALAKLEKRNKR